MVQDTSSEQFWQQEFQRQSKFGRRRKDDVLFGQCADTGAPFHIRLQTLQRHLYIIGESGTGKTPWYVSFGQTYSENTPSDLPAR